MYVAVSVSLPVASAPAGIVITATPAVTAVVAELYVPLLSTTLPVGVGVPLTVIVAVSVCSDVIPEPDSPTLIPGAGGGFPGAGVRFRLGGGGGGP